MAVIKGTQGNDTLTGTDCDDKIIGRGGDDFIDGKGGDDTILGGKGNDTIFGGAGDDTISGDAGDDYIEGGEGNDLLEGGAGNDEIIVGQGNDDALGNSGSDTFIVTAGNHQILGGEDADGKDVDVLDLSGAGNYTIVYTGPESGIIEFRDDNGHIYRRAQFREIEKIICFTPGTGIATMTGEVPVEKLKVGDRVFTRDNGAQEIQWIGRKKLSLGEGNLPTKLQPVLIRKGALGHGLPERDIMVSPNHRMLIVGQQAQLYFEEPEVLVAAKHLVGRPGIEHAVQPQVEYIHFLCERHEVVLSNGAWTETFQPGDQSLKGLGLQQREEIFGLFPELRDHGRMPAFGAARRSLRRFEAQLLNS